MKCLILTGGAGNNMWPLSRNNYPKQFVYLDGEHSMFQETILRNMAFCDEFWIMSSASYKNIIQGQMKPFSGLKYKCFYEEEGKLTAPSLLLACMCADIDEDFLVVSTDNVISNGDYKETIVAGRNLIAKGKIVILGVNKQKVYNGVGFLSANKNGGIVYKFPKDDEELKSLTLDNDYIMDTGILMGRADVFAKEFKKHSPILYSQIEKLVKNIELNTNDIYVPKDTVYGIEPVSIGEALTTKSDAVMLLEGHFKCERIRSLEALANIWNENNQGLVIKKDCNNVSVINFSESQIVVGNELDDLIIVNTADALYVSKKGTAGEIKSIISDSRNDIPNKLLDESPVFYTLWGFRENLQLEKDFCVRKVTVYPGCRLKRHKHNARSENWVIISGEATILLDNKWYSVKAGESFFVEKGRVHQIVNDTMENIVLIETAVGEILNKESNNDLEIIEDEINISDNIIKMTPSFKEKIWGGTKLADIYNKNINGCHIGESWEISAHPNGQSIVASGRFAGMTFSSYLDIMGKSILGWKGQFYDRFPILVKFIDAKDNLSVQVHPGDDYALANENQYGKNEMWYIIEAEEGACIYSGFIDSISREEIERRTADNTLTEVMKATPVKKGETYFIPTGTVHAIGSGIFLCEIQQNSDVTYRLYDYGRVDDLGNTRELHIKKALDVLKPDETLQQPVEQKANSEGEIICKCKYFTVERYFCNGNTVIWGDKSSFTTIIVISGNGSINTENESINFVSGDSYFSPAGIRPISVIGEAEVLVVRI